jgi:hypothetical protein
MHPASFICSGGECSQRMAPQSSLLKKLKGKFIFLFTYLFVHVFGICAPKM